MIFPKIDPGIESYEEISGFGIRVTYKGHAILAGKVNLLNSKFMDFDQAKEPGSVTYLAVDNPTKVTLFLMILCGELRSSYSKTSAKRR
jgi:cation transport ATPase